MAVTMKLKNILFVILSATTASVPRLVSFDFLHAADSAHTAGLKKIAIGGAVYLPASIYLGNSPLAAAIKDVSMLTSIFFIANGAGQIAAEYTDEETQQIFHHPRYDAEIKKLFSNKQFLAGAACGGLGFLLYTLRETPQTPDLAKFTALMGLALMGQKIGEHFYTLFNQ